MKNIALAFSIVITFFLKFCHAEMIDYDNYLFCWSGGGKFDRDSLEICYLQSGFCKVKNFQIEIEN